MSGIRVVKGFGSEGVQAQRLRAEADDVYERSIDATTRAGPLHAGHGPAAEPRSARRARLRRPPRARRVELTVGELVAFNAYVALLIWPLRMTGQIVAQGQRAAAAAGRVAEVLGTDPQIVDHPQPRRLPTAEREPARSVRCGSSRCRSATQPEADRVLDELDLVVEPGASVALVGATGSRQDDRRPADPPLLRRRLGARLHRRRRRARPPGARPATRGRASSSRTRSSSTTRSRANIAFADPDAPRRGGRAGRPARRRARVRHRAARRLRVAHRRARLLALGRSASAHRDRASDPRRPPRAHPRRRHERRRPHEGARDPRRAGGGDARTHHDRDRAPSRHRRARRSGGAARPRAGSSPKAPTTRCSARASATGRCWPRARTSAGPTAVAAPRRERLRCGVAVPSRRKIASIVTRRAAS